jgi:hypothetical protein
LIDKDVVLTTKDTIQYLKIPKPTYPRDIRLRRINGIKAGGWEGIPIRTISVSKGKPFILIFETVFSKKGLKPGDWFSIFDKKRKCDR